ncbi:hypothetical protein GM921_09875 [Pedobacter sp. LMG 31464]|uniref:HTH LytTR-type domain-containing protein n=1 Tax=Pedobacter planticolens TaxID=2679964 RepID=A0A923DZ50_9SPHI|nr:response regulator transcription factor [Pedobacter planticolens]MBB2145795.1 hypothetical protein [Pedobacter planticolens]
MINCYILSELSTVETLKKHIERFPLTKLIGYSTALSIDFNSIVKSEPNIIFVDTSLLLTFKSTLLKLGQLATLIYVSDSSGLAYEVFEALGFDYLVKPLSFDRFEISLNKFIRLSLLAPAASFKKTEAITDSFFIRSDNKGQKEVLIKCNEVIFIEALQNYVVLHLLGGKKFICHNTLKEMEESLPEAYFIRVHKSFIINYDKVTSIEKNNIVLNENEKLKVLIGTTYKKAFFERKNQKMIKRKNYFHTVDYSRTASICLFFAGVLLSSYDYMDQALLIFA